MWSEIYDFLYKGGILMVPILVGSVLALGFFLERLWSLQRGRVIPEGLVARVKALIRQRELSSARVLCQENASAIAQILDAGLERHSAPRQVLRETVQEKGRYQAARLERFVEVLGVIAAIEPLLGLLGTVKGMIEVFHNVSRKASDAGVDVGLLATGIWEALITTAFGLAIAIPVFVGYKYLISRTDRLVLEMEERSLEVVELLAEDATVPGPASPISGSWPVDGEGAGKPETGEDAAPEAEGSTGAEDKDKDKDTDTDTEEG